MAQSVMPSQTIHASAVVFDDTGILILGPSGAGKSALALDLIDQGLLRGIPACLIGDDRLVITKSCEHLLAGPAANLAGLIEVRGSGIHRISHMEQAPLHLAVRLVPENEALRMPEAKPAEVLPGVKLPLLMLPQGHAASRAVLAHLGHYGGVKSAGK
jgi:serine kinase of HPr protein (carbohydrate metabolism regulator)